MIDKILKDFHDLSRKRSQLKAQFEAYITDYSIPLDVRWENWSTAPDDLKNTDDYVADFDDMYIEWHYSWYERHQEIDMDTFVDNVNDAIAHNSTNELYAPFIEDSKLIDKLKEEILKQNLRAFTYDW